MHTLKLLFICGTIFSEKDLNSFTTGKQGKCHVEEESSKMKNNHLELSRVKCSWMEREKALWYQKRTGYWVLGSNAENHKAKEAEHGENKWVKQMKALRGEKRKEKKRTGWTEENFRHENVNDTWNIKPVPTKNPQRYKYL